MTARRKSNRLNEGRGVHWGRLQSNRANEETRVELLEPSLASPAGLNHHASLWQLTKL